MDAADFDAQAARYQSEAAKYELAAFQAEIQNSLNYGKMAEAELRRDEALLSEKSNIRQSRMWTSNIARMKLQQIYFDCLDRGIDPESGQYANTASGFFANSSSARLTTALFRGTTSSDVGLSAQLRELSSEFVGLLAWLRMLDLKVAPSDGAARRDSLQWYISLIEELSADKAVSQKVDAIRQWSVTIRGQLTNAAGQNITIEKLLVAGTDMDATFAFAPPNERQGLDDEFIALLNDEVRPYVIGRFSFRTSKDDEYGISYAFATDKVFVISAEAVVIPSDTSEQFVGEFGYIVVPPADARPLPNALTYRSGTNPKIKPDIRGIEYSTWLGVVTSAFAQWPRDPAFVGGYGDWRIYILYSDFIRREVDHGESKTDILIRSFGDNK